MSKCEVAVFLALLGTDSYCLSADEHNLLGEMGTSVISTKLEVWIGGRVQGVRGIVWPSEDGKPRALVRLASPADVAIHLPGGRRIETRSYLTDIRLKRDRIAEIIMAPLKELTDYRDAQKWVADWSGKLDLKDGEHARFRSLYEGPAPPGDLPKHSGGARTKDGVYVYVEIKRHWSNEGWFVSLSVYLDPKQANVSEHDSVEEGLR